MAFAGTTDWEVRATGSDTNGGGFNSARGGTDYTLQDSAQATGTASSSGTTVTATTGIFTAAMVGNAITNGTSWREITAFTNSTTVTVDAAPSPAWSGATVRVGGAMASLGGVGATGQVVNGNRVFIKHSATAYDVTSSANVSGGRWSSSSNGTASGRNFAIVGYDTTRTIQNTDANRPTLRCSGSGSTIISLANSIAPDVRNLILDGNSLLSSAGFSGGPSGGACSVRRVRFQNFAGTACTLNFHGATVEECEFTGNSGISLSSGNPSRCRFWSNTATCVTSAYNVQFCEFYSNTGASTDAIVIPNAFGSYVVRNCTFDQTGRHAIIAMAGSGTSGGTIENNVITRSGGWGITVTNQQDGLQIRNNAFGAGTFANTSGTVSGNPAANVTGSTTLASGDPYASSSGADFTLTSASGGRGTAADSIPGITDVSARDPGAIQAQASTGSTTTSITRPRMTR